MPMVPFEALPDESRLWVFGLERALEAGQVTIDPFTGRLLDTISGNPLPLRRTMASKWQGTTCLDLDADIRHSCLRVERRHLV